MPLYKLAGHDAKTFWPATQLLWKNWRYQTSSGGWRRRETSRRVRRSKRLQRPKAWTRNQRWYAERLKCKSWK